MHSLSPIEPEERQNHYGLIVGICIMAAILLTIAAVSYVHHVHENNRPLGAFLDGSGIAMVFFATTVFIASFLSILWMIVWLNCRYGLMRGFFDVTDVMGIKSDAPTTLRTTSHFTIVLLVVLAPIIFFSSTGSQFYLTKDAIYYRGFWASSSHRYSWHDVESIKTGCGRTKNGGWSPAFNLVLRKGPTIDLLATPLAFIPVPLQLVQPQLAKALSGTDYIFDTSRVPAECYNPLLKQRP